MTRPAARPLRCILGLLLLLGPGCRPVKQVFQADRELPLRSAEKVVENALAALPADVHYFSAKADVDLVMPDASRSFRSAVRLVTDSALWVSITPALGIEVARALVTVDSVKVLDRLKDTYFVGGRDNAWARFGIDPDLDLLQQALLGRPIGLDPREKYRVDREDGHYVLTSREKRRFVRAAEDILPGDTLADDRDMKERRLERTLRKAGEREAVVFRYWVEPDSFRVVRVLVSDLARSTRRCALCGGRHGRSATLPPPHLPFFVRPGPPCLRHPAAHPHRHHRSAPAPLPGAGEVRPDGVGACSPACCCCCCWCPVRRRTARSWRRSAMRWTSRSAPPTPCWSRRARNSRAPNGSCSSWTSNFGRARS
ncbi:MAG: DUF4292 domain-containing protein [Flavobacteriales bacterium]|nr:DUF4292 domain-containing protein [Flavobacteriales bacterium]